MNEPVDMLILVRNLPYRPRNGKPLIRHEPCDELEMREKLHKACGISNNLILIFWGSNLL